jgi:hypothetical protein
VKSVYVLILLFSGSDASTEAWLPRTATQVEFEAETPAAAKLNCEQFKIFFERRWNGKDKLPRAQGLCRAKDAGNDR